MPKYDLVTIGHVGYDILETASGKKQIVGGAGYFVTKAASLFSKNVGLVSRVGTDFNLAYLLKLGVDISGVKIIDDGKSFRWYSKYDKEFNVVESRGELNVGNDITAEDVPSAFLDSKFIHLASMPPKMQSNLFSKFRESNAKISIDTVEAFLQKWPEETNRVLSQADIIFVNEREFDMLYPKTRKNKQIVKKMGSKGAEAFFNGKTFNASAPKVNTAIDTTGAGDIVAGAFLALLAKGNPIQKSLKEAVQIASKSVTKFGIEHL